MNPLRALTVAGFVGAAMLGSGLLANPFGAADNVAYGQIWPSRGPSLLAAPSGYAAAPGYHSLPSHYSTPTYYDYPTTSAYHATQAYAAPPAPSRFGVMAYPNTGYQPPDARAATDQYQAAGAQLSWPYAQANEENASVLLERRELHGGPPISPPQVKPPAPSNDQMQRQMMPGDASPDSAMPVYPGGSTACDVPASYADSVRPRPAAGNWFGSLSGVILTRDHGDHFNFSYGTGNEADQRTNTRDADMNWTGGFDIRFGKYFNCRRNAIEAVYWGIFPTSQSTRTVSADVPGNLNGIFNWNSLDYGLGTADLYVNVAPGDDGIHQLTRDYAFQNVELNLWRFCGDCGTGECSCSRLRTNWLMGVRYFRFDENLLFTADANDTYISGEDDEISYNIDLENHLVGFQFGNEAQYCVSDRLTADLGIKLGIYGNQINHISEIGGNWGVATINNGPFLGEEFYVNNSKTDVAFLGEVNLGLRYCFNYRWTGSIGYRALAVSGVALPADQIYHDLRGINDVANVDSSRALILHGGFAGLEYNW